MSACGRYMWTGPSLHLPCLATFSKPGMSAPLYSSLATATLGGAAIAVVHHISGDSNALALYGLGALQGALLAILLSRFLSSSSKASSFAWSWMTPLKAGRKEADVAATGTPRTLLKSVATTGSSHKSGRKSRSNNVVLEVEYSLEEYENMRQKQRAAEPKSSSKGGAKDPDSGRPRRQSVRTPKAVSRYVAEK